MLADVTGFLLLFHPGAKGGNGSVSVGSHELVLKGELQGRKAFFLLLELIYDPAVMGL